MTAAATDRERVLATAAARRREQRRRTWHRSVAKHLALSLVAVSMLLPFAWMITTSLKADGDVFTIPRSGSPPTRSGSTTARCSRRCRSRGSS